MVGVVGEPAVPVVFSYKPVLMKAARGALFASALILAYDPNIIGVANFLPAQYRPQATLLLAAALPALRNTLKNKFAMTLGGLL